MFIVFLFRCYSLLLFHVIDQVAALLLLSQQEERRILGEETISAQKKQIAGLQKQLLQVWECQ